MRSTLIGHISTGSQVTKQSSGAGAGRADMDPHRPHHAMGTSCATARPRRASRNIHLVVALVTEGQVPRGAAWCPLLLGCSGARVAAARHALLSQPQLWACQRSPCVMPRQHPASLIYARDCGKNEVFYWENPLPGTSGKGPKGWDQLILKITREPAIGWHSKPNLRPPWTAQHVYSQDMGVRALRSQATKAASALHLHQGRAGTRPVTRWAPTENNWQEPYPASLL